MTAFIVTIHVIVSIALILIVLLQTGKGADMGAVFGGAGSQALFGTTGAATFLGKMTTVAAVVFMITSLSLAYLSKSGGDSVVTGIKPAATEQAAPSAPVKPAEPAEETALPADSPVSGDTKPQSAVPSETETSSPAVAPASEAAPQDDVTDLSIPDMPVSETPEKEDAAPPVTE